MIVRRVPRIARRLFWVVPFLFILPVLSGCDDTYPEDMRYPVRTDPLIKKVPEAETRYPDHPGILPVLTIANMEEPSNPLYTLLKDHKQDILNPDSLPAARRAELSNVLDKLFGSPAYPRVVLARETVTRLKLDRDLLAEGSKLYRIHCLHCHGLSGDGRGPTSFWVNPHPRDYRQGIFKFVSSGIKSGDTVSPGTAPMVKPRREDLLRTLRQGIEGTSMPSFVVLPESDLQALTSYVMHLSLRGETEYTIITKLLPSDSLEGKIEPVARQYLNLYAEFWKASDEAPITPVKYPDYTYEEKEASIKRGQKFFNQEDGCVKCHPSYGRQSPFRFDEWGTMVRPANLTTGVYRGGRRPIDLYWRVFGGIHGSGMANFGGKSLVLTNSKQEVTVWDIVNFLEVLPYPAMREKYKVKID